MRRLHTVLFVNSVAKAMYKLLILTFVTFVQILNLANSKPNEPKWKCPKYWFESSGCCYLVGKKKMTFLEAQEFCKNKQFKLNSTQVTQLAPLYDHEDYDELLYVSMKEKLTNTKNPCKEFPCKWWIRNIDDNEEESTFVGPCVELVPTTQQNFAVHKYADCFEKRRPICGKHLKEMEE